MHGFAGRTNQWEITCHVGSVYKVKLTNTYDVPLSITELIVPEGHAARTMQARYSSGISADTTHVKRYI